MKRKICPEFEPKDNGECIRLMADICDIASTENICIDKDPNYFCPHSEEFIKIKRKRDKDKDKWTKYWESKKSGAPMKEDLPKDLIDKLDKTFEDWERNKKK